MKRKEIFSICFCLLIIIGLNLNFYFYQNIVHPVNLIMDNLDAITGNSDTIVIQSHLDEVKKYFVLVISDLPEYDKNPVWIYPTESTDFLRMQSDVNSMVVNAENISYIPKDAAAYQTGIADINERALLVKTNLIDAKGFLYASGTNVFFTLIWLIGAVGFTKIWIKK